MTELVHDDARDLADAADGNEQAFARLYDRHAAVVLALCRRHQPAMSEAEDAMQETFIRAFRRLGMIESPAKLRPWLYAIARNVCAERRRAGTRRRHHETRAVVDGDPRPAALNSASADIPERAIHTEQLERLGRAIERLDDRQRLAIHLHYLDPDPVAAAAQALGLSRSGYYKLLAQARARLAAVMSGSTPTGVTPGISP